jgi:GT2 family glycosyltransferase
MLSLVIVTYNREDVLVETIRALEPLRAELAEPSELLIIDQTPRHHSETDAALQGWQREERIRWIRLPAPHLTKAMNTGLLEARGDLVLFVDDDIIPLRQLLKEHLAAHRTHPEAWAVVGQVLQPGQQPIELPRQLKSSFLWRDLDFPFNSTIPAWIENAIGCNLSMKRREVLAIGGFDEAFPPPVASRFESEFAKRLVKAGGRIRFSPSASLHHLAAGSGGTRSKGSHLTSCSPRYGVGDIYFALRCGRGWERIWYVLRKPFREVRTRFHLRHPWWIPVKFIGEIRAIALACRLASSPPLLLDSSYSDHPTDRGR